MNRREVKEVHEEAVLAAFKIFCANKNIAFHVIERPDPPDAIVMIEGMKTWIEITDAFLSNELAESITTFAADDRPHKPVPRKNRFIVEPGNKFDEIVEAVIIKKYHKNSIGEIYEKYGKGILIVGINSPFISAENEAYKMRKKLIDLLHNEEPRFQDIFFYDPHKSSFWRAY